MRVGIGTADITPPLGVQLVGYGYDMVRRAESILDALECRCLAVEQDEELSLVLSLDLLTLSPSLVEQARDLIAESTGIAPDRVLLMSTHTHTGPALEGVIGREDFDPSYTASLPRKVLQAALAALEDLDDVSAFAVIETETPPIGYNRALPGGPEDHGVRGLKFLRKTKPPVALTGYACHPVVLGPKTWISADYPGRVRRALRQAGLESIFICGICGDIDPLINQQSWGSGTEQTIDAYGGQIAEAFALEKGKTLDSGTQKLYCGQLSVPLRQNVLSGAEIREAVQQGVAGNGDPGYRRIAEAWAEAMGRGQSPQEQSRVQVFALGPFLLVALDYEVFTGLGEQLRKGFPDKIVLVAGNGEVCHGYLPTTQKQAVGGYETLDSAFLYLRQPVAPGAGEEYIAEIIRQVRNRLG